jgi:hypothetical protein
VGDAVAGQRARNCGWHGNEGKLRPNHSHKHANTLSGDINSDSTLEPLMNNSSRKHSAPYRPLNTLSSSQQPAFTPRAEPAADSSSFLGDSSSLFDDTASPYSPPQVSGVLHLLYSAALTSDAGPSFHPRPQPHRPQHGARTRAARGHPTPQRPLQTPYTARAGAQALHPAVWPGQSAQKSAQGGQGKKQRLLTSIQCTQAGPAPT